MAIFFFFDTWVHCAKFFHCDESFNFFLLVFYLLIHKRFLIFTVWHTSLQLPERKAVIFLPRTATTPQRVKNLIRRQRPSAFSRLCLPVDASNSDWKAANASFWNDFLKVTHFEWIKSGRCSDRAERSYHTRQNYPALLRFIDLKEGRRPEVQIWRVVQGDSA